MTTFPPHITKQLQEQFYPVKHDEIRPATALKEVLEYQFADAPLWQQGIFASDLPYKTGSKEYVVVKDVNPVLSYLKTYPDQDVRLYELMREDRPVRPYFDVEFDAEQLDETEVLVLVLDVISTCLYQVGVTGSRGISIYSASGRCPTDKVISGKKASFHILCDTVEVFKSVLDHHQFMQSILFPYVRANNELLEKLSWTDPKGVKKCAIDHEPYKRNQTFRLPYQSKYSPSAIPRPLVYYDVSCLGCNYSEVYTCGIYEDPSELTFIKVISKPKIHPSKKSVSIQAGVESPEFEKVSALCECLSVSFLTAYGDCSNLIWGLCAVERTERMHDLIHRLCAKAPNYEYKWVESIIDSFKSSDIGIGSLVKWARDCVGKEAVATILNAFSVNHYKELFSVTMKPERHTVIHERYLGDHVRFEDDTDTLLIKSHLGTGKTVSITNLIRWAPYERILIVSPRKSYTYSQWAIFDSDASLPKMESYLDHQGALSPFQYMIVQVESLHRVGEWFVPYDLVILDESESILNQLHSVMTHGDHLINNHQVLELVMRTAGKVILADAFLSDRSFHFIKQLRAPTKTHYLENTFLPYSREAIELVSGHRGEEHMGNVNGFCDRIMTALRAGKKIVVVWTSKTAGEMFIEKYLSKETFVYKFYNSDSTKEDHKDLKDVEASWSDLQCLMYTSSITVGLSYDPSLSEVEFDEAFLYGNYRTAVPRDIAQSLLRVRVLKENRLTYTLTVPEYDYEAGGLNRVAQHVREKEETVMKTHPLANWILAPEWVRWNYIYNQNEEKISRSEYKRVLEQYLTNSGYVLKREVHDVAEEVVDEKKEVEKEKRDAWDSIPTLSPTQAETIYGWIKKGDATRDDKLAYRKYDFRRQFLRDCEEDDVKGLWDFMMTTDGAMERFWNVVGEKRWRLQELASAEARKRYAMMSMDRIKKRHAVERFLRIMGMNYSLEKVVIGADRLAEIGPLLEKEEKTLREEMGLRASQRKSTEWKVSHTIDFIRVMLENWCGGTVESNVTKIRQDGKRVQQYTLTLNKEDILWDKINSHHTNDSNFLIKF